MADLPNRPRPSFSRGLRHPRASQHALPRLFASLRKKEKPTRYLPVGFSFCLFDHRQQRLGGGGGGGGGCGIRRNFLTKDFGTALRQRQATVLVYLSHPCFQSRDFGRVQFCERETLPAKIFQQYIYPVVALWIFHPLSEPVQFLHKLTIRQVRPFCRCCGCGD